MTAHIKTIGLHVHEWRRVWGSSGAQLEACAACGTRRIVAAGGGLFGPVPPATPWQSLWLRGEGELPGGAIVTP